MSNTVGAEWFSVNHWVRVSAGDGDIDTGADHARAETAQGDFNGGVVLGIGDQSVGQQVCPPVGGARPCHANMSETRAAQVLDQRQRPSAQHL